MINKLIVFLKSPQLGFVKTRLAIDVGAERALSIYHWLVEYTLIQAEKVDAELHLYFNNMPADNLNFRQRNIKLQKGDDLGDKMINALMDFKNNGPVVLIGSDCPEIIPEIIEEAYEALSRHDVVLGPAFDGGFYLIGINNIPENIFQDIEWGSSTVYETLTNNLNHLSVHKLKTLGDIDSVDDFNRFEKRYLKYIDDKSVSVETEY